MIENSSDRPTLIIDVLILPLYHRNIAKSFRMLASQRPSMSAILPSIEEMLPPPCLSLCSPPSAAPFLELLAYDHLFHCTTHVLSPLTEHQVFTLGRSIQHHDSPPALICIQLSHSLQPKSSATSFLHLPLLVASILFQDPAPYRLNFVPSRLDSGSPPSPYYFLRSSTPSSSLTTTTCSSSSSSSSSSS